jgi:hypothetical protein
MRHSLIRIAAVAVMLTTLAALPATAGAATTGGPPLGAATISVSIGRVTLSQKVLVTVPVGVTCTLNPGAPPEFPQQGTFIQVDIVQAVAKSQTAGTGFVIGFPCDGAEHMYSVSLMAGSPPSGALHFRTGKAVILAEAVASGYDANFMFGSDVGSTGWLPISIK